MMLGSLALHVAFSAVLGASPEVPVVGTFGSVGQ